MLTLRWIQENGGLASIEKNNNTKANALYREIDKTLFFQVIRKMLIDPS